MTWQPYRSSPATVAVPTAPQYPTPTQRPTMPCFGGDDLKTLYLTSARKGRSAAELLAMPQSGGVFAIRVNVAGLPVNYFG